MQYFFISAISAVHQVARLLSASANELHRDLRGYSSLAFMSQLRRNMTSSTKPEVHNSSQRRIESRPQLTCTENFIKFGNVVFYRHASVHTNKQTNRHAVRNTSNLYWGKVNSSRNKHWPYSVATSGRPFDSYFSFYGNSIVPQSKRESDRDLLLASKILNRRPYMCSRSLTTVLRNRSLVRSSY